MVMAQPEIAVPRHRWWIGILLGSGILVNYFDRINLSIAGPELQKTFGLTPTELGWLFSAFFWSYALLQVPTGLVLDRFGVTPIGRIGAGLWSAATALTALAGGFGGVLVARVLLGVAEAPAFPGNAKATGYWFPRSERALATAIFDAAAKFSNVVGAPLMALSVIYFGWRGAFWATAVLSFAYFLAFWLFYRDPSADKHLTKTERAYIRSGGATPEGAASTKAGEMLGYLLSNRKVWGLTIGFAAYGYSFYLFLTWLPGYLVREMHMSLISSASYTTIPWAVATATDLMIGGWLIDHLIKRGHDETRVRKTVLVIGMLFGLAVFGAAFTTQPNLAILWISIALGGLAAAAPVGWSIPSLISPKGGTGTVSGIMNFANNLMGVVAPVTTGYVVGLTNSFSSAFLIAGVVLLIGIFSYVVLLGRIEPLPDPAGETQAAKGVVKTILLLMGVTGSGKTTVALELQRLLGWRFQEGDDLHPAANVEKMRSGHPLNDQDRQPWLEAVGGWIDERLAAGEPGIITCSNLKRAYRRTTVGDRKGVTLVYLVGDERLIAERISRRKHRYMSTSLLHSQFAALEEPLEDEHAVFVPVHPSVTETVTCVLHLINERSAPGPTRQEGSPAE